MSTHEDANFADSHRFTSTLHGCVSNLWWEHLLNTGPFLQLTLLGGRVQRTSLRKQKKFRWKVFFSESTNQTIPKRRLYTTTNRNNNDNDSETSHNIWMYGAYWCTYIYIYTPLTQMTLVLIAKSTFFWKKNKHRTKMGSRYTELIMSLANP